MDLSWNYSGTDMNPKSILKKISSYEIPTEEVKFGIHFSIRFYFVVIIDWHPVSPVIRKKIPDIK